MVKRSLARKASKTSSLEIKPPDSAASPISPLGLARKVSGINKDGPTLHRGRKKRLEAKNRLLQKKAFIAEEVEKLHAETQKKLRELRKQNAKKSPLGPALAVMSEMAEALPEEQKEEEMAEKEKSKHAEPKLQNPKQRQRLIAQETEQLNSVREHPVFKEDPMEALRQHLMNTVSGDPTEVPPALAEGDAGATKGAKRKRKKKGKQNHPSTGKTGDTDGSTGLVLDRDYVERVRQTAKARVAEKKERKAAMAEAAAKLQKKKRGSKIEKQTLSGLISKPRGRIGVKRPKALG